ncbi:hypothetical protein DMH27_20520 [Raoultella planticola]|nr:hypothetical protein [Raoultella planticola]
MEVHHAGRRYYRRPDVCAPNLYGEDPAVQITGARGVAASEQTLIQVQKTLQEEKLPLSLWHWKRAQSLRASTPPMSSCAHVKCWWTC